MSKKNLCRAFFHWALGVILLIIAVVIYLGKIEKLTVSVAVVLWVAPVLIMAIWLFWSFYKLKYKDNPSYPKREVLMYLLFFSSLFAFVIAQANTNGLLSYTLDYLFYLSISGYAVSIGVAEYYLSE
jgi:hypothetical protein